MANQYQYDREAMIEALVKANGVVMTAAKMLGCHPGTIYNYAEKYATVKEAMKRSRRGLVAEAQGYLVAMMRDRAHKDHYKSVKDVLCKYDEETDWSDRVRQELTGKEGEPLTLTWWSANGKAPQPNGVEP